MFHETPIETSQLMKIRNLIDMIKIRLIYYFFKLILITYSLKAKKKCRKTT